MGKKRKDPCILDAVDFQINFCNEKIPQRGEDSLFYSANEKAVLVGVFDGCGGAGAKKYPKLKEHSGAYIGSRAISGAVCRWFHECCENDKKFDCVGLKQAISGALHICNDYGGEKSRVVSKMQKDFPTTAAVAVCVATRREVELHCFWAGDSRIYLMDSVGLAQLTRDDLDGLDALENLSSDGAMTNVISASEDFRIHWSCIQLERPCFVFSATDGCFGYLPTPMHFEAMLLHSLLCEETAGGWETSIREKIGAVAGDDSTFSGVALGFGDYENMKACFRMRYESLYLEQILPYEDATLEEHRSMWEEYRKTYYRYISDFQEMKERS